MFSPSFHSGLVISVLILIHHYPCVVFIHLTIARRRDGGRHASLILTTAIRMKKKTNAHYLNLTAGSEARSEATRERAAEITVHTIKEST